MTITHSFCFLFGVATCAIYYLVFIRRDIEELSTISKLSLKEWEQESLKRLDAEILLLRWYQHHRLYCSKDLLDRTEDFFLLTQKERHADLHSGKHNIWGSKDGSCN